jgi:hypothetical protein
LPPTQLSAKTQQFVPLLQAPPLGTHAHLQAVQVPLQQSRDVAQLLSVPLQHVSLPQKSPATQSEMNEQARPCGTRQLPLWQTRLLQQSVEAEQDDRAAELQQTAFSQARPRLVQQGTSEPQALP